jgi:hypothetical protein
MNPIEGEWKEHRLEFKELTECEDAREGLKIPTDHVGTGVCITKRPV